MASNDTHSPGVIACASIVEGYFHALKPDEVADHSHKNPFDIVIIGSGMGGGVLASDLIEKNLQLAANTASVTSQSTVEDVQRLAKHLFESIAQFAEGDHTDLKLFISAVRVGAAALCDIIVRSSVPDYQIAPEARKMREQAADLFERIANALVQTPNDKSAIAAQAADLIASLSGFASGVVTGDLETDIQQEAADVFNYVVSWPESPEVGWTKRDLPGEAAKLFVKCIKYVAWPAQKDPDH
ncbi:hypothetical protein PUNSTDRAFT_131662 [Punctularia strigosozonata HHB-11173 SS5]|uniref:uncharacterized protein n=1 Tax=Punctularia strigosozonata (strain HHB-11173) TaxID=741275 RepID=UPI0004416897|nr:uncharacterized protein PUNSTDRAFT_131662 [Punctularia strigosozonata HHB-11173 SS5]EIN11497.1 hypothetical protein PUNSTDRAFT_131662 [Punctularia strigosozonata HHB-11173 SS5]